MKYLSVLLFSTALIWTWFLIHSEPAVSFETHFGIQEKMGVVISEAIAKKKPTASEIKIERIWTEVIGDSKIKAHFIYSFKDNSDAGAVTSQIQGEGILERQPVDETGADRWSLSHVQTTNDVIQFEDPSVITNTPNTTDTNPAESTATSPETHPESPPETQPTEQNPHQ